MISTSFPTIGHLIIRNHVTYDLPRTVFDPICTARPAFPAFFFLLSFYMVGDGSSRSFKMFDDYLPDDRRKQINTRQHFISMPDERAKSPKRLRGKEL